VLTPQSLEIGIAIHGFDHGGVAAVHGAILHQRRQWIERAGRRARPQQRSSSVDRRKMLVPSAPVAVNSPDKHRQYVGFSDGYSFVDSALRPANVLVNRRSLDERLVYIKASLANNRLS
jgi:hypothetical protein